MSRSPHSPFRVIFHSHPHFVIKSTSIHLCVGFTERPFPWLSNDDILRKCGSKLEVQGNIKHWDFQAPICHSSYFMMETMCGGGLLGLIESPYSRLSVNFFSGGLDLCVDFTTFSSVLLLLPSSPQLILRM